MNILEQSEALKDLPEQVLMREMQMPSGNFPQYLVLTEIKRRKRVRDEYQRREAQDMPTVAEEAVQAAGMPQEGVMQLARNMAPQTNMGQNTSAAEAMPQQPTMGMAEGGITRLREGGMSSGVMTAISNLKVNYPDVYEAAAATGDPKLLAQVAQSYFRKEMKTITPDKTGLEEIETVSETKVPIFGPAYNYLFDEVPMKQKAKRKLKELEETQPERALQARIDSRQELEKYDDDDPIFAEGTPVANLFGNYELPAADDLLTKGISTPESFSSILNAPASLPSNLLPATQVEPTSSFSPAGIDYDGALELSETIYDAESGAIAETERRAKEAAEKEALAKRREFLADETSRGVVDAAEDPFTRGIINELQEDKLYGEFLEANFPGDINRRALKFLQSDQYTPPEEIPSFAAVSGGDPRFTSLFAEEGPGVFKEISDRIASEAQEAQIKKEKESFSKQDADAQAKILANIRKQIALGSGATPFFGEGADSSQIETSMLEPYKGSILEENKPVEQESKESSILDRNRVEAIVDKVKNFFTSEDNDAETGTESVSKEVQNRITDTDSLLKNTTSDTDIRTAGSIGTSADGAAKEALIQKGLNTDQWLAIAAIGAGMSTGNPKDVGPAVRAGLSYLQKSKQGNMAYQARMKEIESREKVARINAAATSAYRTETRNNARAKILLDEADSLDTAAVAAPIADQVALRQQAEKLRRQAFNLIGEVMPELKRGRTKALV